MQMKHYLYCITCLINNKVYIGITQSYFQRIVDHKYKLKVGKHRNRFLQEDYNKYGEENFAYDFISEFESKTEALRIEKYYTDCLLGLDKTLCYNIVSGGNGGYFKMKLRSHIKPITEETREKLRQRSKRQKQSIECREKRKEKLKGGRCYRAKKVVDKETGKVYLCLKDAAPEAGVNYNTLRTWLNGIRPNKSTFQWH